MSIKNSHVPTDMHDCALCPQIATISKKIFLPTAHTARSYTTLRRPAYPESQAGMRARIAQCQNNAMPTWQKPYLNGTAHWGGTKVQKRVDKAYQLSVSLSFSLSRSCTCLNSPARSGRATEWRLDSMLITCHATQQEGRHH